MFPLSVIQNNGLVAEMVMTELGIDSEEYETEEKIIGSPFPLKLNTQQNYLYIPTSKTLHGFSIWCILAKKVLVQMASYIRAHLATNKLIMK